MNFIISIAIFILYIICVVCLFNIPWSISNTYYLLEENVRGWGGCLLCFAMVLAVSCYPVG